MSQRLTAKYIQGLKSEPARYYRADDKVPGFAVAVHPTGNKTFVFRYRKEGSRNVLTKSIGNAMQLSVDDARAQAKSIAGEIAKGTYPGDKEQETKAQETIDAASQDLQLFTYIDKYFSPYAKQHSVTADENIDTLKRDFEFIKDKMIDKIDHMDIEEWRKRRRTEITFDRMVRIYTNLKACINTAVRHYKLIDRYELQYYTLKRKPTEKVNERFERFMTKDEEKRLRKVLADRDQKLRDERARYVEWHTKRNSKKKKVEVFGADDFPDHITPIIVLTYKTGFDLGDIFDLDWQLHIDLAHGQIRKTRNKTKHKANKPIVVTQDMAPEVKDILEQWGRQHGLKGRVFKSPVTGGRLDNINKAWKAIKTEAKLENFRLKDFRHTFGSWLAIAGYELTEIRDLMGHSDMKTTQVYAHLCPKRKKKAMQEVFN